MEEGDPITTRRLILGLFILTVLFLTVPNLIDAAIQSWYCIQDDAPVESTIRTFWWHLTTY